MSKKPSDEELERLAKAELLREAKRGAERSLTMGTQGWLKPKLPSTNKRFLHRTLKSAIMDASRTRHSKRDHADRSASPSSSRDRPVDRKHREVTKEKSQRSSSRSPPRKRKQKSDNAGKDNSG